MLRRNEPQLMGNCGMNVADEDGVTRDVSIRRLTTLLEGLKRTARRLARSQMIAREARNLARL